MALNAVDFRKTKNFDHQQDKLTVSGDGDKVTIADGFTTGSDRCHCMMRLPDETVKASDDFQIRWVFKRTSGDTWSTQGAVALGTMFGNQRDWAPTMRDLASTIDRLPDSSFMIQCGVREGVGGSTYRFYCYGWQDKANANTMASTLNVALNTPYFVTLDYDADGGAGGAARITVTVRTGSHTGTQVEQFTNDMNAPATHDLVCFTPAGDLCFWDAAYSDKAGWEQWGVEASFDLPDDDQSVAFDNPSYDLAALTTLDPQNRVTTQESNSLVLTDANKHDDGTVISAAIDRNVSGSWWCFAEASTTYDDWFINPFLLVADALGTWGDLVAAGKNAVGGHFYWNNVQDLRAAPRGLFAGVEDDLGIGINPGKTQARVYHLIEFDPDVGANGTLSHTIVLQHPGLFPWGYDFKSGEIASPFPANMNKFILFCAQDQAAGSRASTITIRSVSASWLTPLPADDSAPRRTRRLSRLGLSISLGTRKKYRRR